MSRLENILPVTITCTNWVTGANGHFVGATQELGNLELSPFEKQIFDYCRGTYSFKEIALLLYSKVTPFSFTNYYEVIRKFANEDVFKNKEQVLSALLAQEELKNSQVATARTKEELIHTLRKISLFASLPLETLQSIANSAEQKVYKTSETIIKKDSIGDEVYVLLSGEVGVYASFYLAVKGMPLAKLKPITVFGESAAISGKKRTADVVATQDSLVLKFHISKVVDKSVGKDLNKNLKLRLVFQQLVRLHPVFKSLPGDILQLLLNSCNVEKVAPHQTVVQQGEVGQNFYFILSGAVNVIKNRIPEVKLTVGTYFGEVGALQKQARTASIVTETECVFLVLSEKNFIQLLASNLVLALAIEKEIQSRTQQQLTEAPDPEETEEITMNIQDLQVADNVDFSTMSFSDDETT
jgi:CRP-like cAMP-binding protein